MGLVKVLFYGFGYRLFRHTPIKVFEVYVHSFSGIEMTIASSHFAYIRALRDLSATTWHMKQAEVHAF